MSKENSIEYINPPSKETSQIRFDQLDKNDLFVRALKNKHQFLVRKSTRTASPVTKKPNNSYEISTEEIDFLEDCPVKIVGKLPN